MFRHHCRMIEDLFEYYVRAEQGTSTSAGQTQEAEKLKRARRVIQQEFDDDQVQKYAYGAADAVVGFSALAFQVFNGNFDDSRAGGAGERRNEAVQLAVELNFLNDFAAVGLEGRAEIVQFYSGELRHHPIGGAARDLPHQPVVAARIAPSAYQVVAFFDLFKEAGNLFRIMLEVAVHRDNDTAASEVESGLERRCLAKIAPQPDQVYTPVVFVYFG